MAVDNAIELREKVAPYRHEDLAPADYLDPVIEAYKKDVDRTMLRENLKLSTDERSRISKAQWSWFGNCAAWPQSAKLGGNER